MFFDALDKVPRGLIACVFDGTDRLQHTFWRDIDERHPARPDADVLAGRNVIEDLYRRMDDLVGKTMAKCRDKDTLLMVISDHGFGPFRTGRRPEPLARGERLPDARRRPSRRGAPGRRRLVANARLRDRPGRHLHQHQGQVRARHRRPGRRGRPPPRGDRRAARPRWSTRRTGPAPSSASTSPSKFYRGPYKDNGPDLIVGYQRGYRVSWETAIGRTTEAVFHANTKAWSGDHCVDPSLVPGILFCNRPIENENPRLIDIGPTVLSMFGVAVPDYMDGKALTVGDAAREGPAPNAKRPWPRWSDD